MWEWSQAEKGGCDGKEDTSGNTSKQSQLLALIFITWRTYYTCLSLLLRNNHVAKRIREEKMQLIFSHKVDFHNNTEFTQWYHETKEHILALRSDELRKNSDWRSMNASLSKQKYGLETQEHLSEGRKELSSLTKYWEITWHNTSASNKAKI